MRASGSALVAQGPNFAASLQRVDRPEGLISLLGVPCPRKR